MKAIWIAAVTQARREKWARENILRDPSYDECYLPVLNDKGKEQPLFPRYLFVHSILGNWSSLLGTFGVSNVVKFGDRVGILADNVISDLKAQERNGVIVLPEPPKLVKGDAIQITQGPFSGVAGIYDGMPKGDRILVLLSIMSQQVNAYVDSKSIKPLDGVK